MNRILDKNTFGKTVEIRALVDGKEYLARFVNEEIVMLHRVTKEAGGRLVGGTVDKFSSISRNNAKWIPVCEAIKAMGGR